MRDWIDNNLGTICIVGVIAIIIISGVCMSKEFTQGREAAKACRVAGGVLVQMDEGKVCAKVQVIE